MKGPAGLVCSATITSAETHLEEAVSIPVTDFSRSDGDADEKSLVSRGSVMGCADSDVGCVA
jgi:hypothetical protein